ncbi:sodium/calcium exchanger regulatory protein 1-like [Ptychodera flava]|uniref:sodium/calcium exchanger regulatory protein 1-like n=1 Tax=Ptychodera flava TaxID=63121 RepID=UPI003969F030
MADFIFAGKWRFDRSENFDEYLQAIGFTSEKERKGAAASIPILEGSVEDGFWVFRTTVAPGRVFVNKYKLGEVTDQVIRPNGGSRKAMPTMEGENFVVRPLDPNDNYVQIRRIVNGELLFIFEVGDVVCKRYFKKIE